MKPSKMPTAYIGREQAYIKHTILKSYLERLFMIVGQHKETVINYVDCFAGPWQEGDEQLRDTSIAISLQQMANCQLQIEKAFKKKITFRALYIEKRPERFAKLKAYLDSKPFPAIETRCLNGDYTKLIDDILAWHKGHFTFFFVDPTAWKEVVDAKTMSRLLELDKSEFLINLMYEFVNRFVEHPDHRDDMEELFGESPEFSDETPEQRQQHLLSLYRNNIKQAYKGRSTYVTVEKPGKEKTLYCLVYLTRSPLGISVFKEEAENMEILQRTVQQQTKIRHKSDKTGMNDLFGNEVQAVEAVEDRSHQAKQYILNQLSREPVSIDHELWADWLEQTDLYPSDFQMAMKELLKENRIENISVNASRRSKKPIHPDWLQKAERWRLL